MSLVVKFPDWMMTAFICAVDRNQISDNVAVATPYRYARMLFLFFVLCVCVCVCMLDNFKFLTVSVLPVMHLDMVWEVKHPCILHELHCIHI